MRQYLVSYLRLLGFSLTAVAIAVCTRLTPQAFAATTPEPRATTAPEPTEIVPRFFENADEDARMAELEARLEALDAEIVNLRKVLDVMGPLPAHPELFIPVALADIMDEPAQDISRRYSQTRDDTRIALFRSAELGALPRPLQHLMSVAADLAGRHPGYEGLDTGIRLAASADDEAVNALCVRLPAVAGPARAAAPIRASW